MGRVSWLIPTSLGRLNSQHGPDHRHSHRPWENICREDCWPRPGESVCVVLVRTLLVHVLLRPAAPWQKNSTAAPPPAPLTKEHAKMVLYWFTVCAVKQEGTFHTHTHTDAHTFCVRNQWLIFPAIHQHPAPYHRDSYERGSPAVWSICRLLWMKANVLHTNISVRSLFFPQSRTKKRALSEFIYRRLYSSVWGSSLKNHLCDNHRRLPLRALSLTSSILSS